MVQHWQGAPHQEQDRSQDFASGQRRGIEQPNYRVFRRAAGLTGAGWGGDAFALTTVRAGRFGGGAGRGFFLVGGRTGAERLERAAGAALKTIWETGAAADATGPVSEDRRKFFFTLTSAVASGVLAVTYAAWAFAGRPGCGTPSGASTSSRPWRPPCENRGCRSAGADPWTWGRVMSSDLGQFLEACGANGPLRLEWDDWETGRINLEMKATGAGLARPDPGAAGRVRPSF